MITIRSNKILVTILLIFFTLTVLVFLLSQDFTTGFSFADNLYLISSFIPVLGGLYALKLYGMGHGRGTPFLFITLGFFSLFIGEFLWAIFEFIEVDPFPSVADFFYILFYPLLFIGLWKELKISKIDWSSATLSSKILMFLAAVVLVGLVGYFGVYFAYDVEASVLENIVSITYGVGDLILVLLALFVLRMADEFKGGRLFFAWLAFFVGLIIMLLADIGFAIYYEAYEEGVFAIVRSLDLLWIASFLFLAYGLFGLGNVVKEAQRKVLERIE